MDLQIDLKKERDESYDIVFDNNSGKIISHTIGTKRILVVTDKNVSWLHLKHFLSEIKSEIKTDSISLWVWENYKNMSSVLDICSKLDSLNFNRNDYLIVLGWWVVGDIAWFAAAIYKRWIHFIQIPTTLLSMLDSSVWGKTGVNFENQKNLIGNFKQPRLVIINPVYLQTLPVIETLSWFFEWVKHSLIDSPEHFDFLQSNYECLFQKEWDAKQISNIIQKSIQVKADIVQRDETEQHERKYLNYGHTFGHALESDCNFEIPHGICIAYGMMYENILSEKLGKLSKSTCAKINSFIQKQLLIHKERFHYYMIQKVWFENIYEKMCHDKKNDKQDITFIILLSIWSPCIHEEKSKELLFSVFQELQKYTG